MDEAAANLYFTLVQFCFNAIYNGSFLSGEEVTIFLKGTGGEIQTRVRILDRPILPLKEKIWWVGWVAKVNKKIWMKACKLR